MQAIEHNNRSRSRRGYTLIEMVSVLTILSIVGMVSSYVIVESMKTYALTTAMLDASYQARLGTDRLVRDIRYMKSPATITTFTSSALSFDDANDVTVAYSFSGGDLTRNGDLLARGVTAFALTYWKSDGTSASVGSELHLVEIDLTVAVAGEPYRLQTAAFPRSSSP